MGSHPRRSGEARLGWIFNIDIFRGSLRTGGLAFGIRHCSVQLMADTRLLPSGQWHAQHMASWVGICRYYVSMHGVYGQAHAVWWSHSLSTQANRVYSVLVPLCVCSTYVLHAPSPAQAQIEFSRPAPPLGAPTGAALARLYYVLSAYPSTCTCLRLPTWVYVSMAHTDTRRPGLMTHLPRYSRNVLQVCISSRLGQDTICI